VDFDRRAFKRERSRVATLPQRHDLFHGAQAIMLVNQTPLQVQLVIHRGIQVGDARDMYHSGVVRKDRATPAEDMLKGVMHQFDVNTRIQRLDYLHQFGLILER
jgi:hypothetical protein